MPWIIGGATLLGGYLGSKGAKDAARTSASASNAATEEQRRQYDLNRQDMQPYMNVAVGAPVYAPSADYQNALDEYQRQLEIYNNAPDKIKWALGKPEAPNQADFAQITGYEGGALNKLADYGRSQVKEGDYIPASEIPQFGDYVDSSLPAFNVSGEVSRFDPNIDITQDPSYQFRQQEQERAINRNMAGMGKLFSGNRLEELMKRGGEMATQEYAAADQRARNTYGLNRNAEDARYGRDLTAYEADRQNNLTRYARGSDLYSQDAARESTLYNRGVGAFGRAYGMEGDYLNRLANLSNIGQTATTNVAGMGTNMANSIGANIVNAGNANAAAQIGQASAWQNMLGDFTSLYAKNKTPTTGYSSGFNPTPLNTSIDPNNWRNW